MKLSGFGAAVSPLIVNWVALSVFSCGLTFSVRGCRHKPLSRRTALAIRTNADSTAAASPSSMYAAKWRLTCSRWIGSA